MPTHTFAHKQNRLWYVIAWLSASFIIIPIVSLIVKATAADHNIWPHLSKTVLPLYIKQTTILMIGVGGLATCLGVSTGYLVARYDFTGRRLLEWALILPLAVPTYLVAYIYTDLLEYAGPVQRFIREMAQELQNITAILANKVNADSPFSGILCTTHRMFEIKTAKDYPFFEIRSMGGAITTLSLVLYPYVYLLARAAFLEQSQNILESSRILGSNKIKTFWRVTLPLARPAIIVGVMLVLMEVINDFGAVHHFAIQTFSEGIYDYWLGRSNIEGASQIALMMLSVIICLMVTEQISRKKQSLFQKTNPRRAPRQKLTLLPTAIVIFVCLIPVFFGFIIPVARLIYFVIYFEIEQSKGVWIMAWNSLSLSLTAALLTGIVALAIAYARRLVNTPLIHGLGIISGLGYAIPGAVLAIGVLVPFGLLDRNINNLVELWLGERIGLIFSGTIFIIVIAYMIRFMSVAQGTIYAGLQKITPSMDESAQTLGCSPIQTVRRIHFPLLKRSILTAMLIVFVDSMKELPATLILRPFNFDTLATNVYQYASDELLEETSLAALMIIFVGLLPIIWLNHSISRDK